MEQLGSRLDGSLVHRFDIWHREGDLRSCCGLALGCVALEVQERSVLPGGRGVGPAGPAIVLAVTGALVVGARCLMNCDNGVDFKALTSTPPPSTGEPRRDAPVAGVTEDIAFRLGYPVPGWTAIEPLDEWWFVTPVAKLEPTAFVDSPSLLNR